MTESEWQSCADPQTMLQFLQGRASDRKLRLFACACCRRFWHLLVDSRSQQAVDVSERFADALARRAELASAGEEARSAGEAVARQVDPGVGFDAARAALLACAERASPVAAAQLAAAGVALACAGRGSSAAESEHKAQADLLRCIFGNLFRPDSVCPGWQTPQLVALTQAAYDERELPAGILDTSRLAVLADALEEAGCDQPDLLAHLRSPGPHVRGCWAVDLLLGKA